MGFRVHPDFKKADRNHGPRKLPISSSDKKMSEGGISFVSSEKFIEILKFSKCNQYNWVRVIGTLNTVTFCRNVVMS